MYTVVRKARVAKRSTTRSTRLLGKSPSSLSKEQTPVLEIELSIDHPIKPAKLPSPRLVHGTNLGQSDLDAI